MVQEFVKPEIGSGMTLIYPQDDYPLVVVGTSASGKTVKVRRVKSVDRSTGHAPARYAGQWPIWDHIYSRDELESLAYGPTFKVRYTRKGWTASGTPVFQGHARYYRNYSH